MVPFASRADTVVVKANSVFALIASMFFDAFTTLALMYSGEEMST